MVGMKSVLMPCIYFSVACVFAALGIETEGFMILTILLLIDFVTGITKSFVLKQEITSKRMRTSSIKKMILLIVPIVIALMLKSIKIPAQSIMSFFVGVLCVAESYSILGNVVMTRTGKKYKEFDAVTYVLSGTMDRMQKKLDKRMGRDILE